MLPAPWAASVRQGPVGRPGALAGIRPGRADRPASHGKRLYETEHRRRGLAFPEDGTYLTAECVYQTPELPSPSPLSAELLQFRDEAVKYWARYQENADGQLTTALDPEKYSQYPSRAVRASAWRNGDSPVSGGV